MVNIFEDFTTNSPSSLRKELVIESKKQILILFSLFAIEMVALERFLQKLS